MKVYGLIGFPLTHSFSSKYFSDKFASDQTQNLYSYKNFEIRSIDEIKSLLESESQLEGLNVTAPYKTLVIPFLNEISGPAQSINAVNTIKITRDENYSISRLTGFNTDVIGFQKSLQPLLQPHHKAALVLGTGGAAKAVKWVLKSLGIDFLTVSRKGSADTIPYEELNASHFAEFPLIINTTPVGSHPFTDAAPQIPYEFITKANLLFDLVYNPEITQFLQEGIKRGAVVKNGLEMLHLQADEAWKIWTV